LTNAANWNPYPTYWYHKVIGFWNTEDYPDYTYTRTISFYSNLVGNTLTLCNYGCTQTIPWSGPTIPAGTPVANMYAGSGYNYVAAGYVSVPSAAWIEYQGSVSGWKYGQDTTYGKFRYGTKYVRVMFLANHGQSSSYSTLFDDVKVTIS